jgi:predicted nucleic acid-binding protein
MDIENSANPDFNRKAAVADWQRLAVVDLPVNETVEEVAELLSRIGVKPMDALHVACAIEAHAEYFLTTDNALLRKMVKHGKIRVVDPVDFVRVLKVGNDEN